VEKVEDNDNGTTFNFVATMEYKHKSEAATQQEARRIRSQVLQEHKVVVLNLMFEEDVECFRSAVANVDYRCQILHECVTCNASVGCYAVGTTQVEFVVIVIVPPTFRMAYNGFTGMVRTRYLNWLFKPNSNEFDETQCRMPRYRANDIAWGYVKDEDTIRCRLGVMMGLYTLRKEQGKPLLPPDGMIPKCVGMWNVGKGAIDDMSQVLASCLPTFGPFNGMCWMWIRTWMMMLYNA
jgi:hypothetical protein